MLRGAEHCLQLARVPQSAVQGSEGCSWEVAKQPETFLHLSTLVLSHTWKNYRKALLKPVADGLCRRTAGCVQADQGITEWKIFALILLLYGVNCH